MCESINLDSIYWSPNILLHCTTCDSYKSMCVTMTMIWKTVQNNEQCSVLQSTAVSAVRGEDEWWGLQCCSVPAIIMLQLQHQPGSTLSPTQPLTVTNISMSQTFYRICFEKKLIQRRNYFKSQVTISLQNCIFGSLESWVVSLRN